MPSDCELFQSWLMLSMSATRHVDRALRELGPREAVEASARAYAARNGLDAVVPPFAPISAALGEPVRQSTPPDAELTPSLQGSTVSFFQLPRWPELLFRVCRHPSGYAWGMRFAAREGAPPLQATCLPEPWSCVREQVTACATDAVEFETWGDRSDWLVRWPGSSEWLRARFDFELLQCMTSGLALTHLEREAIAARR